jgi:serine/threonine protein kinase
MEIAPNSLFHNRYRLLELKGRGSFGEVWLARDEQLDMDVAIKIFISLDERGLMEFGSEYRNTYGFNHPNLLHAYHFAMCEQRPYLVMAFCPGSAVGLVGHADETTMWRFIRDVASGLAYLHSKDIVHHDIKPDNILIDEKGNFVISDFGISTKMRSTLRRNSARGMNVSAPLGGSMAYMGPEMFSSQAESIKATDIWALGATLFELATGELPFFGQGGVMLLNGAELPRPNVPFSDTLINTIMACLAKETWDRPLAAQLVEVAKSALAGAPVAAFRSNPPVDNGNNNASWTSQSADPMAGDRGRAPLKDAAGMGTVIEGADNPILQPKKKKKLIWLWILLPFLILLPAAWFAYSFFQSKAEEEMLANCRTADEYRAFLKKYPKGENADFARTSLSNRVRDSIERSQQALAEANKPVVTPEPAKPAAPEVKKPVETKPVETKPATNTAPKPVTEKPEKPVREVVDTSPDDDLFTKPQKVTNRKDSNGTYTGYMLPTGKYEGYGRLVMTSGDVYDGNWKNNKRHGQGKYSYANGEWYSGNWTNGVRQGQGEFHYKTGNVYRGNFSNGKPEGYGEMTYGSGSFSSYKGNWSQGNISGRGVMYYRSGDRYDGEWRSNKRHGQGTYYWANGDKYIGTFVDGNMSHGTVYAPNGTVKETK